jgi:hypothetical protein
VAATFLSYRREDSAGYAGRLRESLERRLGGEAVFRDVDTIAPGQDFVMAIDERLRECSVFVALIGREWADARDARGQRRLDQEHDYVRLEIAAALARPDVRVVPVLVEGVAAPTPDELPESIRALARRQAISLRDETWDADVERLTSVIRSAASARSATGATPQHRRRALIGVAALLVLALVGAGVWMRDRPTTEEAERPERAERAERATSAYALDIPRVSEVAHDNVIYTVMAANVHPRSDKDILRVRVQFINGGQYDANFWDASFRLAAGGQVFAPTSGLNEVVPGRSVRWGVVSFDLPPGLDKAVLQLPFNKQTAELPLDLSPTNEPPAAEEGEIADSLARAIRIPIVNEDRPLIDGGDINVTLRRVTTRRFVNMLRMVVSVRMTNEGRYPAAATTVSMRVVAGAETLAPTQAPEGVLESKVSTFADWIFDLPPSTKEATLRATVGNKTAEVPLTLR